MRTIFASILSVILLFPLLANAEKYKSMETLTGKFGMTGKTLGDVPPDEPRDTHMQFYLTGKAAKALYEGMKIVAVPERCENDPNVMSKYIGDMTCQHTIKPDMYECFFGVNIEEQKIEGGWMC